MDLTRKLPFNIFSVKSDNKKLIFSCIFSFSILFVYWMMCETIKPISTDDAMYANWTRHGVEYFFEQLSWHMVEFNGRTLVHVLLSLTLIFEEHLYAIIIPLCLYFGFFFFSKSINVSFVNYNHVFFSGFCSLLFLGLPHFYIVDSSVWMAASFNYIVPFFICSFAYWCFNRFKDNQKRWWVSFSMLLISGATTEQYGIFMFGIMTITVFFDIITKQKQNLKYDIISLVFSFIGILSIFLTPGTFDRIGLSVGHNSFMNNFYSNNANLLGHDVIMVIFIMFGFSFISLIEKYKCLRFSWAFSLIISLLYCLSLVNLIGVIFFVFITTICVVMLCNTNLRKYGQLMVCGYGTFFMLFFVDGSGFRTCVPFLLTLMLVLTSFYFSEIKQIKTSKILVCIVCLLTLVSSVRLYGSYNGLIMAEKTFTKPIYNSFVVGKNSDSLELDFDVILSTENLNYRFRSPFDDGTYIHLFALANQFDCDKKPVSFHSDTYSLHGMSINGTPYLLPIISKDKGLLVPVQSVSMLADGELTRFLSLEESYGDGKEVFGFYLDENNYYSFTQNGGLISVVNGETICCEFNVPFEYIRANGFGIWYFELDAFCRWINCDYTYDANTNMYNFNQSFD